MRDLAIQAAGVLAILVAAYMERLPSCVFLPTCLSSGEARRGSCGWSGKPAPSTGSPLESC
jgi:hypothetical protein